MPTVHWVGKPAVVNYHHEVPYYLLPHYACKSKRVFIIPLYSHVTRRATQTV